MNELLVLPPRQAPPRPRRRLGAPMALVAATGVATVSTLLVTAVGAARTPASALVPLCACALALGLRVRPAAGGVVGLVFWLFLDGFVVHHRGVVSWDGSPDAVRLGLLIGSALLGSALGALAPRLSEAALGLRTARRRFRRASLEAFTPELPPRTDTAAWN
ncbi:hypothetical protein ABIA33_005732 [Streptacidiphilus sp. MAP12-16]|uniref:hypothetical protein n=1 Tax=Streptacidiphilus sp. MAP12-16 TaxID=3156300 RepID=UPI0035127CB1